MEFKDTMSSQTVLILSIFKALQINKVVFFNCYGMLLKVLHYQILKNTKDEQLKLTIRRVISCCSVKFLNFLNFLEILKF